MNKKKHWGFFAGLCGVFAFYLTVAFVALGLILGRIEAETNGQANLFGTWWQVVIFVLDLACVLGMAAFIGLAVFSRKRMGQRDAAEAEVADEKAV